MAPATMFQALGLIHWNRAACQNDSGRLRAAVAPDFGYAVAMANASHGRQAVPGHIITPWTTGSASSELPR